MVRTSATVARDHEPIPAPTPISRVVAHGRGKDLGRGRGWVSQLAREREYATIPIPTREKYMEVEY